MRRTVPLVALALVVAVAGCLALTPSNSPTDGATPTVESTPTDVTVPARFDAGHGLVVTDVTATDPNGTPVPTIRGADGHRASIVRGHADGQYSVEFAIDSVDDRPYNYWFVSETGDVDR